MATATIKHTGREALMRELMRDYGCATEQELRMRLRTATAWAEEHNVAFGDGFGAIGPHEDSQSVFVDVASLHLEYYTAGKPSPAHRRLLESALALFLFSHPVTRRQIEEGRCVYDPD